MPLHAYLSPGAVKPVLDCQCVDYTAIDGAGQTRFVVLHTWGRQHEENCPAGSVQFPILPSRRFRVGDTHP
jgi:hypothetical protein